MRKKARSRHENNRKRINKSETMECGQYVRKCSKQTVTSVKDLTLMIPEVSVSPNIDQTKIVNLTNSQIKGL